MLSLLLAAAFAGPQIQITYAGIPIEDDDVMDWGLVHREANTEFSYTIANVGDEDLRLVEAFTSGQENVYAIVPTDLPDILTPGETTIMVVRGKPTEDGAFSSDVSIRSSDPVRFLAEFGIEGTASEPRIDATVDGTPIGQKADLGGVIGPVTSEWVLENGGLFDLFLTGEPTVRITAQNGASAVVRGPDETQLAPRESTTFFLDVTPVGTGEFSIEGYLEANIPGGLWQFELEGYALEDTGIIPGSDSEDDGSDTSDTGDDDTIPGDGCSGCQSGGTGWLGLGVLPLLFIRRR